jgi:molybdate transport system substrate-binding protein
MVVFWSATLLKILIITWGLLFVAVPQNAIADTALIAVAANFAEAMTRLEQQFEAQTNHKLTVTFGSTGKLYAQIVAGAPIDVLLAADQVRPAKLEDMGLAVADSRFTYAVGQLALWSADPLHIAADGEIVLRRADFRHLAIANPKLAPYGEAARQALMRLGLYEQLAPRLVMGENVGQAYALVATGNAELGLVALSAVLSLRNQYPGSQWLVPLDLYDPIRQDAILLRRAEHNQAALAFVDFLQSRAARTLIEDSGYAAKDPALPRTHETK